MPCQRPRQAGRPSPRREMPLSRPPQSGMGYRRTIRFRHTASRRRQLCHRQGPFCTFWGLRHRFSQDSWAKMVHCQDGLRIEICPVAHKRNGVCIRIQSVRSRRIMDKLVHAITKPTKTTTLCQFHQLNGRNPDLPCSRRGNDSVIAYCFFKYLVIVCHGQ